VLQRLADTVCRDAAAPHWKLFTVFLGVGIGRNF